MHITQFPIKNFNWFGEEIEDGKAREAIDKTAIIVTF